MRFKFRKPKLQRLYEKDEGSEAYPDEVIDGFFEVMSSIYSASSLQDLRALKGLKFEKLKGKRKKQHSLRINRQWRLIVEIEEDANGKILRIVGIEDYH